MQQRGKRSGRYNDGEAGGRSALEPKPWEAIFNGRVVHVGIFGGEHSHDSGDEPTKKKSIPLPLKKRQRLRLIQSHPSRKDSKTRSTLRQLIERIELKDIGALTEAEFEEETFELVNELKRL